MTYNPGYPPAAPVPPVPPKKTRSTGVKVAAGIITGLVALCCIGGIIAAATSGHGSSTPPAAAATTPVADIAGWRSAGGTTLSGNISTDLTAIQAAGKATDLTAMQTACTKLQTDVEAAQAYKPIPDAQAQQHWAQGLAYTARAASDCIAGISQDNVDLLTKTATEMTQAGDELQQAGTRMQALAG